MSKVDCWSWSTSDAADRAGEGQARELGGHRRRVDGDHVVGLVRVQRHHGDDDLDLVAQALDEAGAQRPVDEAAGQDRALGRTALAPEERAGDLARGVHPLLDVDGQGEEVDRLAGLALGRGGREQHGVLVEVDGRRPGGLPGQQARLETHRVRAVRAVVDHGFGELQFWSLHGIPLFGAPVQAAPGVDHIRTPGRPPQWWGADPLDGVPCLTAPRPPRADGGRSSIEVRGSAQAVPAAPPVVVTGADPKTTTEDRDAPGRAVRDAISSWCPAVQLCRAVLLV
jgi:hypothetical protein